jgi:hypothetical protein
MTQIYADFHLPIFSEIRSSRIFKDYFLRVGNNGTNKGRKKGRKKVIYQWNNFFWFYFRGISLISYVFLVPQGRDVHNRRLSEAQPPVMHFTPLAGLRSKNKNFTDRLRKKYKKYRKLFSKNFLK